MLPLGRGEEEGSSPLQLLSLVTLGDIRLFVEGKAVF